MRNTLYRSGSGGPASPTKKFDEFLFFADPSQDFCIAEVVPDNRYEQGGSQALGSLRVAELYALWDALMAAHPDYITKDFLGKDESGEFDIYRYNVNGATPRDNNNVPIPGRKIRVMIEAVHNEYNNRGYMFEFIRMLFTQDHLPAIKAMKECMSFSCIPIANPYGLQYGTRQNSRGVDINSNQKQGWTQQGSVGDFQYSGPYPESEVETRIVAEEMDRFQPDIHISCHSHGNQEPDGSFFWSVPSPSPGINNTSWKGCMRACTNLKQIYPDLQPPEVLIQLRSSNYPEGKGRSTDAAWIRGAISMSIEAGGSLAVNGKDGVGGSKEAITLDVMGVLFCVLEATKRIMYY